MSRVLVSSALMLCVSLGACRKTKAPNSKVNHAPVKIVLATDVKWEQLNPARGDKSPKAADLWGNRKKKSATGFLVQFVDGFRSPPHIHNVTYRAVVLRGLVHNDDANAKEHWMPRGSFWTQPKGEAHITAARGKTNIVYVEIDKGPYLVRPTQKAFDSGERPINVDRRNVVWLTAPGAKNKTRGAKIAYLWGNPEGEQPSGRFLKLPKGFTGSLQHSRGRLRAVLIEGTLNHKQASQPLTVGSSFSAQGAATHRLTCQDQKGCLLYLRAVGQVTVQRSQ